MGYCTGSALDVSVRVKDAGPPTVPRNVAAGFKSSDNTKLEVSWTAPEGFLDGTDDSIVVPAATPGPRVTHYDYRYRRSGGSWFPTASTTDLLVTIDDVSPGHRHEVEVRGSSSEGPGAWATMVSIDPAIQPGVTVSESSITVTEGAAIGTSYTIVLDTQPAETDTVTVTVGGVTGDLSVTPDPPVLTFTSATWDTPQQITVSAVDDETAEGTKQAALTHTVAGYGSVTSAAGVTVTIEDNDTAGVTVSRPSVLVREGGAAESYDVVLTSEPAGTVTVTVGGVTGDLSVTPSSRTFTSADWNTPKSFTVTATDDSLLEGEERVILAHAVSGYGSVTAAPDVEVTVVDDDGDGVAVSPSSVTVAEGETTGKEYVVVPSSEPSGTVTVTVGGVTGDLSVTPSSHTFTSTDWNTPKSFTVTATDDSFGEGPEEVTLTHAVTGYPSVTSAAAVTVTIEDNETTEVTVSETSVAVTEGAATGTSYTLVLASEPEETATVTVNGAGEELRVVPSSLTFTDADWNDPKMVKVSAVDDRAVEGEERVVLTHAVSGYGPVTSAPGVTVTITDDDRGGEGVAEAQIARFGRTVTDQVLEAVGARLAGGRESGVEIRIGGHALVHRAGREPPRGEEAAEAGALAGSSLATLLRGEEKDGAARVGGGARGAEPRTLGRREVLAGSAFSLAGGSGEGGRPAGWGRMAVSGFDGREGDLSVDGEVVTGMLGADFARDRWKAGVVLSRSRGDSAYRTPAETGGASMTLTALHPFAGVEVSERMSAWAAAGYGEGRLELGPEGRERFETDLSWRMGAAGLVSELRAPGRSADTRLSLRADVRSTRTRSEAAENPSGERLEPADTAVWRLRIGLEGTGRLGAGAGGASVVPSFALGLRRDGGDAETGLGADVGGRLALSDPGRGLSLDLAARGLLVHEAGGFREWGASAALGFDPDPASPYGLRASLRQSRGASSTGGADALLARRTLAGLDGGSGAAGRFAPRSRLEATVGYAMPVFGGRFTGTPELGLGLAEGGHDLRLGWRLGLVRSGGGDFDLDLAATRRERPDPERGAELGITVRGRLRW